MVEQLIVQALQSAAVSAVAQSIMPALPIAYLGRTFDPKTSAVDGRWLELVYIPNNVIGDSWDSSKTYRGLFRLILHWGLDDAGVYEPLRVISSVSQHFSKGSKFKNGSALVHIYENPDLTGLIESPPEMLFPVSIRYLCFQSGE